MDLTEEDVLEILKLFEQSKFDYLNLEQGGRKITVSKGGFMPVASAATPTHTEAAPAPAARHSTTPAQATPQQPARDETAAIDPGLVAVTAPMVGKFYAAPSPSDPPFVQTGQRVATGATMGLIEVMKVFASVKTEVAGVVEKMLIANGQSVEHGQALFLIRPD